jgi:flavin reductase (DIM6/NTAB) family NADH-FMN oxidoreductase RutF/sugar phosphate isomerase/epimerase
VVQKHGLTCAMANGVTRITEGLNRTEHHPVMVPGMIERIGACADAGLPNVICFSGSRGGMDDELGLENCATALKQIVGTAEKRRITVCMELLNSKVNHPDYMCDHTAWGVELVKRVGSDRFKLLYDIYHMQIMEGDVIATIEQYHPYFGHYHPGDRPRHQGHRLPRVPGAGVHPHPGPDDLARAGLRALPRLTPAGDFPSSPGAAAGRQGGMYLDFASLATRDAYQWISNSILPRPIAWVSTISPEGRTNLAPFSFFQAITANPPTLMFVPSNNREGGRKDTLRNIELVPEFVVNFVTRELASPMNDTATPLPYGESEFERFGLSATPSTRVRPPRVAASPIAFECTLDQIVHIGSGPLAANVVFGRIVAAHVRDDVIGADGFPDPARLDLVGRLGREAYATTRETFSLKRPDR